MQLLVSAKDVKMFLDLKENLDELRNLIDRKLIISSDASSTDSYVPLLKVFMPQRETANLSIYL